MQDSNRVAFSEDGLKAIQDRIKTLRIDLGASGAILLDQTGALLVESGHHADLDVDSFLARLGNAMSAMNAVVHLLKDEGEFDLHFHEGQIYDIHTARIDDRIFLTLIFERHSGSSRVGMILLSLRRAVTELRGLVRNSIVDSKTVENEKINTHATDDLLGNTASDSDLRKKSNKPVPAQDPLTDDDLFWNDFANPGFRNQSIDLPLPPQEESPAPPKISREILDDPKHVLTYDEARALGLINLDESKS